MDDDATVNSNASLPAPWLSAEDLGALRQAMQFVSSANGKDVTWFPRYGCAALALPSNHTQALPGETQLHLLGLDSWQFVTHR